MSACKTKTENNSRYIVFCTASRLYSIQHKDAVSYIFRLEDQGRKEMKLNNECL